VKKRRGMATRRRGRGRVKGWRGTEDGERGKGTVASYW